MIGTIINVIAVAVGSLIGLLVGDKFSKQTQSSIVTGLGLVTLSVGMQNSFKTGNVLIPLFSIAIGVIIGEMLDIQGKLNGFGGWLQKKFASSQPEEKAADGMTARERFINGFVTASLVFCVGPLTVLGSLSDGMSGDYELLTIKSALDFFAAMAFAASLGGGVFFSIITVIVVQGGLSLGGFLAGEIMTKDMTNELTATGGMILMGLSLILLDIKHPRVANYLPALLIAPLIVAAANALGINLYPNI